MSTWLDMILMWNLQLFGLVIIKERVHQFKQSFPSILKSWPFILKGKIHVHEQFPSHSMPKGISHRVCWMPPPVLRRASCWAWQTGFAVQTTAGPIPFRGRAIQTVAHGGLMGRWFPTWCAGLHDQLKAMQDWLWDSPPNYVVAIGLPTPNKKHVHLIKPRA